MTYDPLAAEVRKDPYPFYAALRRDQPISYVPSLDAWAVSRFADVKEVTRNHEAFSSDILLDIAFGPFNPAPDARYLIASDPPEHTRLRLLIQKAFTGQIVYALTDRIRAVADELIDDMAKMTGPVDLMENFTAPLPVTIIAELLGVERSMRAKFRRWSNQVTIGADQTITEERRREGMADAKDFRAYLDGVIEERRKSPRDDLISALIRAEEKDSRLSAVEVLAFAVLLIIAGNETTTNTLGNTIVLLARHPEQRPADLADRDRMMDLVDESLRYWSPVQLLFRRVTRDVTLVGKDLPAGARVMPIFAAANRDDAMFAEPDRFDAGRANARHHLAFGFGIHRCIGSLLGQHESSVALQQLLGRAPDLRVLEDGVQWLDSFFLKGPKVLPVELGSVRPRG